MVAGRNYVKTLSDPIFAVEFLVTVGGSFSHTYSKGPYESLSAARGERTRTLNQKARDSIRSKEDRVISARVFQITEPNWEEVLD